MNQIFISSMELELMTNDADTFSLELVQSSLSDAGRYVCVAVNEYGEVRSMISLMVQKTSGQASKVTPLDIRSPLQNRTQIRTFNLKPIENFRSDNQLLQKRNSETRTKPSVVFEQAEYLAVEGGKVILRCKLSGYPEPKSSWYQGKDLINELDGRITHLKGLSYLELLNVKARDSGTYTCRAENDLGTSCATCQLSIQRLNLNVENMAKQNDDSTNCATVDRINSLHDDDDYQSSSNHSPRAVAESEDSSVEETLQEESTTDRKILSPVLSGNVGKLLPADVTVLPSDVSHVGEDPGSKLKSNEGSSSASLPSQSGFSRLTNLNSPMMQAELNLSVAGDDDNDDAFEKPLDDVNSRVSDEPPLIEDLQPENIHILCGSQIQLIAKISGHPLPDAKWLRGGELLVQDERTNIETKPWCTVLTIENAQPQDTGIYALVLVNEFGQDKQLSSVTIEDKPDPPVGRPAVTSILENSVVLSWSGSSYDGGCPVLRYRVELSQHKADVWENLTDDCKHTTYHVHDLVPNTEYVFRVSAANKHGFSNPGDSSEPIITNGVKASPVPDEFPFIPRNVTIEKDRKFSDFYVLGDVIGKGKFGSVHKCSEKSTDRLFAAKFIRVRANQRDEFRQEVEIMNRLHHPKVLLLWDAFESARDIILVMEHVSGGELMERIINDDYILTERECIHFMRQICEGVLYMHSCNILHLDVKPENILCVTPNSNEIKIIDFGLARKFDPTKEFRIMFGTAEFVAPEVINYDTIGYTTDMWSVGVICYVLLSGLSPFLGDNDKETFVNVTKAQFDFDDESFDEISEDAKDFICKLLVKDPRKRMDAAGSLQHKWLAQDVTYMRAKKLSTDKHKKFMVRSKWQKTGRALVALRRMVGLQRLSSGNLESFRSSCSSPSQADTHSVFSDATESNDSGFASSQFLNAETRPSNPKSIFTIANDQKRVTEHENDGSYHQEKLTNDSISSYDALQGDEGSNKEVSENSLLIKQNNNENLEFSQEKTKVHTGESDGEKEQILLSKLPTEINGSDNESAKSDEHCAVSEKIDLFIGEDKTQLSKNTLTQPVNLDSGLSRTSVKKLSDKTPGSQAASHRREFVAERSIDLQSGSRLHEPVSRSFDQDTSSRVSDKFTAPRRIFDNPSTSVMIPRTSQSSTFQGKALSKPITHTPTTKATDSTAAVNKPLLPSGHINTHSKTSESSVAARKLAVQQSSAQKSAKPKKAPAFVRKLKNLDVMEGGTARFEVLVDGNPPPTVLWFKDGEEILLSPEKYTAESNDSGKCLLTILDCGEDDDAEYGCKASNSLGSVTSKANLYVEPLGEVLDIHSLPKKQTN